MSYSLPETDTRKIMYQIALEARQKTGTGFLVPVLAPISVTCVMGIDLHIFAVDKNHTNEILV